MKNRLAWYAIYRTYYHMTVIESVVSALRNSEKATDYRRECFL